jgi:ABC-type lipoprotein release transport system permease subunit
VVAAGLALGLAGAFFATRALGQLLFEVDRFDGATYIAACLLLAATALAACWLPARRASRVEPIMAMRE